MLATALTVIAIVTQDASALRAAPREAAAQQAVMWQGDALEIRGEKGDYLQVYDHRRERAGYVRASQVRVHAVKPEAAPELMAVVRFLKDTPGSEALGIAYAAAYLRAAPAEAIDGEIFDALGTLAERLARRGSVSRPGREGETVAAHLDVAASYGVQMRSQERDGRVRLCYTGDAHRRVLALAASDAQKANAALALSRHDCVDPALTPVERQSLDAWRADVLDRVPTAHLPEVLKNRLRLRKAGVWAGLAYQRARRAEPATAVQAAAQRSLDELACVNKTELMDSDSAAYQEAAIRVGASRWAAEPHLAVAAKPTRLGVTLTAGAPGETCVALVDPQHEATAPLYRRCTYGQVWAASATPNADGTALSLAVQTMAAWRELWVFRKDVEGWTLDVAPPGLDAEGIGYVEFAGWVPGGKQFLAARETLGAGSPPRSFELLRLADLEVEKRADKPENLSVFYRWQSPLWKARTVAVR